jgi:hypothetical protein
MHCTGYSIAITSNPLGFARKFNQLELTWFSRKKFQVKLGTADSYIGP